MIISGHREPRKLSTKKGGHHEKTDSSYCTSSTVNRCVRGRIRASRAAYSFAVAKPIGNPTDRLHQCWSALPVGTHLDLHSKRMCVCALRCLLWRSLEIPLTPLALALLGGSRGRHLMRERGQRHFGHGSASRLGQGLRELEFGAARHGAAEGGIIQEHKLEVFRCSEEGPFSCWYLWH